MFMVIKEHVIQCQCQALDTHAHNTCFFKEFVINNNNNNKKDKQKSDIAKHEETQSDTA